MPTSTHTADTANPLLQPWDTPYGLPPFEQVQAQHFAPAFEQALAQHRAEIDAIATQAEAPSFDNTLAALDQSGRLLNRISLLFHNLTASETSSNLQAAQRDLAPRLAAHESAISMHPQLFARIDALHARRDALGLTPEQLRLLERAHLDFSRAGARLGEEARQRYSAVMGELAVLCTRFSQNVLAAEAAYALELRTEADRAGLPDFVLAAARAAAQQRGLGEDTCAITLSPSLARTARTITAPWRRRSSRCARNRRPCTALPTTPT